MAYPSYAQKKKCGRYNNSDPINLIFLGKVKPDDVENYLKSRKWKGVRLATDLFVDKKSQTFQLADGYFWARFHVRIWDAGGHLLGSAHYETLSFKGHTVHHFEGAESEIRTSFEKDKSNWAITGTVPIDGTFELKRFNDGMATLISKK